jgi:hypothetical protein
MRVAVIVILDDPDHRDCLLEWAEEHNQPVAVCDDMSWIAEIADSLPTDPAKVLQVHFTEPSHG